MPADPPGDPRADVVWGEPVDADGGTFTANPGRTVPVKADLWIDGRRVQGGDADLRIWSCDGDGGWTLPLSFHGGRWYASIDTTGMEGTCYDVHAWTWGLDAGSFRLLLRGDPPVTNVRGRDDHRHGGPHHLKPKPKPEPHDRHRPKPGKRHFR